MKRSVNEFRKEVSVAKVHRKPGFKILFKKSKSGLITLDIVQNDYIHSHSAQFSIIDSRCSRGLQGIHLDALKPSGILNEFRKEVGVAWVATGHKVLNDFKLDFVHKTYNIFNRDWNSHLPFFNGTSFLHSNFL